MALDEAKVKLKFPVTCGCGYGEGKNHPVGIGNCCRFIVTDPKEIPTNRRRIYDPSHPAFTEPGWAWTVGGYTITEYTLLHQRMYHQHENSMWTRPKDRDSVNSLEGDW